MVNKFTNINKTIISHLATEHQKRPGHVTLEIKVLAWDRHKNVAGLYRLVGSQPSVLDNFL